MTVQPEALFHVDEPRPAQVEELSADRRRTIRQLDALRHGRHPLGLVIDYPIRLHPDAPPADDREADGPRCGGCRFRQVLGYHTRSYPKCLRGGDQDRGTGPFVAHSTATDVRRWWPACEHWEAGQ